MPSRTPLVTLCFNLACSQPRNSLDDGYCATCGSPLRLKGRYRCQSLLGQGGFGRTYLALDEGVNPPALCVVKQTVMAASSPSPKTTELHERFQHEAERLRQLGEHPQIPRLLAAIDQSSGDQSAEAQGIGTQGAGQFLVQEYIPGPNLEQFSQAQPLEEVQIRRVLGDLLPVLQFIHQHQVIHRDIKPANIIVPPPPHPLVLVDFGASKAIQNQAQLEKTGTVIGSAGYVAPEQALGKAVFASDIFSLGVTCLHLLTGLHPFDLYSVSEDAWQWRPFTLSPVSESLGRVLDRMVNRRLKERYTTAQEVLTDLRWGGAVAQPSPAQKMSPREAPSSALVEPSIVWQQRFVIDLDGVVANGVAVSPSGRAIAAACSNGAVRLWDCTNGHPLQSFNRALGLFGLGHRSGATTILFGPQGEKVWSGGEDGQLICWHRNHPDRSQPLPIAGWAISAMVLSPESDQLVVGTGEGRIYVWPLGSGESTGRPQTLVHHSDRVTTLALDATTQTLISGSLDRTIRLWVLPSGRLIKTITAPVEAITALACHPEDGRIVSGDAAGRVQVWGPTQPEAGLLISQESSAVTALAISPNGHWLGVGRENGSLNLWSLPGPAPEIRLTHGWAVKSLAFTPDSRMVVSTGADETIRFWCLAQN